MASGKVRAHRLGSALLHVTFGAAALAIAYFAGDAAYAVGSLVAAS